jgi:hypothetical protein
MLFHIDQNEHAFTQASPRRGAEALLKIIHDKLQAISGTHDE